MTAAHLAELTMAVERLKQLAGADAPVVEDTTLGMRLALTVDDGGYHLSASHAEHDVVEPVLTLQAIKVAQRNGVTHFRLVDGSILDRHRPPPATNADSGAGVESRKQPVAVDDADAYFQRRPSEA